jgi:hypothetical protein
VLLTGSVLLGLGVGLVLAVLFERRVRRITGHEADAEDLFDVFVNGYLLTIGARLALTVIYLYIIREPIGPLFFEDDKIYIFALGAFLVRFSARRIIRIFRTPKRVI